jgi:hypothetical protein
MSLAFYPVGLSGRSTLAEDSPGAIRYSEYQGAETREPQVQMRLFNDAGEAAVVGGVYLIVPTGVEEENPKVIDVAADTVVAHRVAVAIEAVADQAWGWFAVGGYVDALVEGTTDVAVGDFLKTTAATSATAFFKDATARSVKSFAVACTAQASATPTLTKVYLLGDLGDVD